MKPQAPQQTDTLPLAIETDKSDDTQPPTLPCSVSLWGLDHSSGHWGSRRKAGRCLWPHHSHIQRPAPSNLSLLPSQCLPFYGARLLSLETNAQTARETCPPGSQNRLVMRRDYNPSLSCLAEHILLLLHKSADVWLTFWSLSCKWSAQGMLSEGLLEVSVWEQYLLKSYLPYAKSFTKHYNGEMKDIKVIM